MSGYRQKASYLVIGADAGISQRRIRENDLRWPSQIDANGFDPSKLGQDILDNDFIYPDISAGLLWFSVMNKYTNWYLGAAIHHLNQPNVSFFGDGSKGVNLYNRITPHGGGQFEMKPKISFLPLPYL